MLLQEFNLIRGVIDFDPVTGKYKAVDISQFPDHELNSSTPYSEKRIRGKYADIGGERVFRFIGPDLKHLFFQDSHGFRLEINDQLIADITDRPSPEGQALREFRLKEAASGQTRFIAIYDAMPILQGFWQDFTPYIDYKDWDFYAHLSDTLAQIREDGVPAWYEGPAPADYFDPLAAPSPDRRRAEAGQPCPRTG